MRQPIRLSANLTDGVKLTLWKMRTARKQLMSKSKNLMRCVRRVSQKKGKTMPYPMKQ